MERRRFLKLGSTAGLFAAIPLGRWSEVMAATAAPGKAGRFLTALELDALRAVTDRLIPGPPEDPDPGARQARCAEAIDMLLGAFTFDPPLLYSGGPWSNRAGGKVDLMARFVRPDAFEELGWRIRLEGSKGLADREFAGPVVGYQEVYRSGLASLESRAKAGGTGGLPTGTGTGTSTGTGTGTNASIFAVLSSAEQDQILMSPELSGFVTQALQDSINAMYGPPEYGGNRNLVGWTSTHWPGDVQPRGYTDEQVSKPHTKPRHLHYTPGEIRTVAAHILPGLQIVD